MTKEVACVMDHHANRLRLYFSDCTSEEDIRRKSIESVKRNSLRRAVWGGPAFPGLDDPEKFQKFVDAYVKVGKALLSGDFVQVPDFDENGRINLDTLCEGCVNPRPGLGHQCELYDAEEAYLDL